MKKVFLLLVLFSMVACQQDDNDGVAINEASVSGKWYFESSKLNKNDYVIYNHPCSSKDDYIEFSAENAAKTVKFMSDCTASPDQTATWSLDGTALTVTETGAEPKVYQVKNVSDYKLSLIETTTLPDNQVNVKIINYSRY